MEKNNINSDSIDVSNIKINFLKIIIQRIISLFK